LYIAVNTCTLSSVVSELLFIKVKLLLLLILQPVRYPVSIVFHCVQENLRRFSWYKEWMSREEAEDKLCHRQVWFFTVIQIIQYCLDSCRS